MSVGTNPAVNQVKDRQFSLLELEELRDLFNVPFGGLFRWKLTEDTVDICVRDPSRSKQSFPGELVVALIISGGNAALIHPENVNARPIEIGFGHLRKESLWRAAT